MIQGRQAPGESEQCFGAREVVCVIQSEYNVAYILDPVSYSHVRVAADLVLSSRENSLL